ncbi:MAG: response regulator, partial [Deltaproteobacteria bacterium]
MFSSKKSVMIIDDDLRRRKKVYDVLKITGFDIFSASTGQEAMGRLPREKPRMVIVNAASAAVDGIEFIRRLRTYGMGQKMIV